MDALTFIAESRIREAFARGEFDDLPGKGKPLPPDEAMNVPEGLRMAYRVMKNAGYITAVLGDRREQLRLKDLLRACDCEGGCVELGRKISPLRRRELEALEQRNGSDFRRYRARILRKLGLSA